MGVYMTPEELRYKIIFGEWLQRFCDINRRDPTLFDAFMGGVENREKIVVEVCKEFVKPKTDV